MAKFHGKAGSVTVTGDVTIDPLCVKSFTIDTSCDSSDASCMGTTWKNYLAGCKGWTATIECNADNSGYDIAELGESGTFTFTETTGIGLTGTGIVSNISGSQSATDTATVSYSIQGTGALAGI